VTLTMVKITCHGGVNEIGGNKIVVQDGDVRFSFDFGTSFKRRHDYFEEYLKPRPGVGLLDLLYMGLLPPLEGIYRRDLEPTVDFWQRWRTEPHYRRTSLNGVLLSHAHLDHSGYISFLDPQIPIYSTLMTAFISKAIQDSGQADFESEVCYANLRGSDGEVLRASKTSKRRPFLFVDGQPGDEPASSFWNSIPATTKDFQIATTNSPPDRIGSLLLRHFPLDHSIFGACAYAVETSAGWLAYTGDLRLHGSAQEETKRFVEELRRLRPLALLCEGTRAGDDKRVSEGEVRENALREVKQTEGLVVADFGPRNVERLVTFLEIAEQTGRKLLVLAKDAYLLEAMHLAAPQKVPDIVNHPEILVYADPKASLRSWERTLRDRYGTRVVRADDVRQQKGECILCFSFWDVNDLIDIEPEGGVYIYSSSEAYSEEQRLDLERLRNWLDYLHVRFVGDPDGGDEGFHSSGHASGPDLLQIIRNAAPRILIPIHTEQPDYFVSSLKGEGIEVRVPVAGKEMALSS
jgi:ribonuclease J